MRTTETSTYFATEGDAAVTLHLASDTKYDKQKVIDGVCDWFGSRQGKYELHGERSVHLEYDDHHFLKIKGAGYVGGPVLNRYHRTGPVYPRFDFEGKKMVDISMGHDGSLEGGMNFCQAYNEFAHAGRLMAVGERIIPSLGWGKLEYTNGVTSWFTLHLNPRRFLRTLKGPLQIELMTETARKIVRLNLDHGFGGFVSVLRDLDDNQNYLIDFHAQRYYGPDEASAITMTMIASWSCIVHIAAINFFMDTQKGKQIATTALYREILPQATDNDMHEHQLFVKAFEHTAVYIPPVKTVLQHIRASKIACAMFDHFCKSYPSP